MKLRPRRLHCLPLEPRTAPSVSAAFSVADDWGTGFQGGITLTNSGPSAVQNWTLEFDYDRPFNSIWDAQLQSQTGGQFVITNTSFNATIAPNSSVSFGFVASPGNVNNQPTNYRLNGVPLDGSAYLKVTGANVVEGGPAVFTVSLTPAATTPVTVHFATENGSATAPGDFTAQSGTLTFTAGQSQQTVPITTVDDTVIETNETITLRLSNPQGATISQTAATATILDNDTPAPAAPAKRVAAYFPEWGIYDRNFQVSQVPAAQLTHLVYAFAQINAAHQIALFDSYAAVEKVFPGDVAGQPYNGNFWQLRNLKQQHPHLKTLIAVGGWTLSEPFAATAATATSRATFAASVVQFLRTYQFDGVDLDWEYPVSGGLVAGTPADAANYTLLVAELRSQLTAAGLQDGKQYLITMASAAGWQTMQNFQLAALSPLLDWFNVMTYDYHGTWENQTNHNAPIYASLADPNSSDGRFNTVWTVQAYVDAGVPAAKIHVGAPVYGRAWRGVGSANNGLYQPSAGAAVGTWEPGMFDYKDLYSRLQTQPAVYTKHYDAAAGVPYIYAASVQGGLFSTYEDPQSITERVRMVYANDFGGVFFWELSADMPATHPASLVGTAAAGLLTPPPVVQYVMVNDGSPQRSRVTSLTVTFDRAMTVGPAGIEVRTQTGTLIPMTVTPLPTSAVVTFAPLVDGRYTLTVNAADVRDTFGRSLDGDGNGTAGGDHEFAFHRLFGDADGNAAVNFADFLAFRAAFGSTGTVFDADNDGAVNFQDFLQFRSRFGTALTP